MLDFTWRVFSETGCIDTYLLFKELEKEQQSDPLATDDELAEADFPLT
ncbi:hypothetical protein J2S13_000307 [Oikeobacillus pervagus]|uniref:YqzL family protein n=1 Tax=Oikeobacillus pervagus TaxID=1325931 RepID=A0AAJ1WI27_9BACI|nr:YqzL family protein [Oikeobacillus pervagus]MDQ0213913.1 hypothetical protein [Oikeobacillus pervagus]